MTKKLFRFWSACSPYTIMNTNHQGFNTKNQGAHSSLPSQKPMTEEITESPVPKTFLSTTALGIREEANLEALSQDSPYPGKVYSPGVA